MLLYRYLIQLNTGKKILWCYLIWYLVMCNLYFDGDLAMWSRCLGLGLIVGFALVLSTGPANIKRLRTDFWQIFRLCSCPFLVSSFSSLVKGKGFFLILSPYWVEDLVALTLCMLFMLICFIAKSFAGTKLSKSYINKIN